MAGTGNVVEDLEAIRKAQVPGTYMYDIHVQAGRVPWWRPASGLAIKFLKEEIPEVPDDLIDLLSVTEVPASGILDFMGPIGSGYHGSLRAYSSAVHSDIAPFGFVPSDEIHRKTNRTRDDDDGWVPDGDLFWFQVQNNNRNLGMAMGGPNHGRVYSMNEGYRAQRIGYRLRDVVACTRELYENGWFTFFERKLRNPLEYDGELEEKIAELVLPVVEKWHCSPRVACLVRHTEPSPPADL